jgi:hypothetical protein
VPDDLAISGFELGMSGSGRGGQSPFTFLSTRGLERRRGGGALNRSLTIFVLTPLTTFSACRVLYAAGTDRRNT